MRRFASRLIALAAALASASLAGCRDAEDGIIKVAVIGTGARLTDTSKPLTPAEQVVLANAGQGLVRFDARGQIEPGLAERWNVSDDGLSYIFRIAAAEWPDGSKVTAQQVARILRRSLGRQSRNPLRDSLGAVVEVVAMTDRVLELRLAAPRPSLLQLLAQPEMGIVQAGGGSGPFRIKKKRGEGGELRLVREVPEIDGEDVREEEVWLSAGSVQDGLAAFQARKLDLLLGGTFSDLPLARAARLPRNALQFDPVAGLFGLVPTGSGGPLQEPEVRRLLSQAIDREAFLAALAVPDLLPRATILQDSLEGVASVPQPSWQATPLAQRRAALMAESERLFGADEKPRFKIALPDGPGADLLFRRLEQDWGMLGLKLVRVGAAAPADLRLVDAVAASTSPSWFLRQFRCEVARVCSEEADELLDLARQAGSAQDRAGFFLAAAERMEEQQVFLPIAAPVRWALVSSEVHGFAGNRFARHTLTNLRQTLERNATE